MTKDFTKLAAAAETAASARFAEIDRIAEENTLRVLDAFRRNRVSDSLFSGTTGYGYDDAGRDTLDRIFAELFGAEDALVRTGFVNGTHAITCSLFAAAVPGKDILSLTGLPYDTLRTVIGIAGDAPGSLKEYGVGFRSIPLGEGEQYYRSITEAVSKGGLCCAAIQRSRGYETRRALSVGEIEKMIAAVRMANKDLPIIIDNCYGEFTETREPTHVGATLIAGSLIKNPGGGLAPTGGYIAGDAKFVERAAARLTCPGIGRECGSTNGMNRALYQGLFLAPHTTAQAIKTSVFAAYICDMLGFDVFPKPDDPRCDIIQTIQFHDPDKLLAFCRGIQSASPVDAHLTPEPWEMPGYDCPVVMAAGTFIQGSSIELSADAPMREPYTVYIQGGLTYESGKAGILNALKAMDE